MSERDPVKCLRGIPDFGLSDIPEEAFQEVLPFLSVEQVAPGSYVIHEGDESNAVFFLAAGEVIVEKKSGNTIIEINRLQVGELFGETAVLTNQRRSASIRAAGPVVVVKMTSPDSLWHADKRFLRAFVTRMAGRMTNMTRVVQKQLDEARRSAELLRETHEGTLIALSKMVARHNRDEDETRAWRVAELAALLGKTLDLAEEQTTHLRWGALLHDIGTLAVPDEILRHPGHYDEYERGVIEEHPKTGAELLQSLPFLRDACLVVRYHHERWDGLGYPDGLVGEDIPLEARIFAVANAFDAMTTVRPHAPSRSFDGAVAELREHAGSQFDPEVVRAFLQIKEVIRQQYPGATGLAEPVPEETGLFSRVKGWLGT